MARLTHSGGGEVSMVGCDATSVTLETTFPAPPGSTLELLLEDTPLKVKVRSCRRLGAEAVPSFRIEGRWVTLPRSAREALLHDES